MQHLDGSLWLPTLSHLLSEAIPTVLTMYDEFEADKTLALLQLPEELSVTGRTIALNAAVVFGPEMNPMRSLVVEEAEGPIAAR